MEQKHISNSELNVTQEDIFNSTLYENCTIRIRHSKSKFDDEIYRNVLDFAVIPVVCILGAFGNISTIILFTLKKQKTASITFILGLAISDLLFLTVRLLTHMYNLGHQFSNEAFRNIRPHSLFWSYLSLIPQRIGFLFILIIVMERITAVWFPFQLKQIWTTRRARFISIVLVLLALGDMVSAIDILMFSLHDRIPKEYEISLRNELLRYIPQQTNFILTWSFTYRIMFEVLPLPVVFILNIIIIIGIRRNAFPKQGCNMKSQQRTEKEARMTRMLLTTSVMFILLCGPYTVITMLANAEIIDGVSVAVVVYDAFLVLSMVNSVINFVVYGINDPSLRKEYLVLWKCRK